MHLANVQFGVLLPISPGDEPVRVCRGVPLGLGVGGVRHRRRGCSGRGRRGHREARVAHFRRPRKRVGSGGLSIWQLTCLHHLLKGNFLRGGFGRRSAPKKLFRRMANGSSSVSLVPYPALLLLLVEHSAPSSPPSHLFLPEDRKSFCQSLRSLWAREGGVWRVVRSRMGSSVPGISPHPFLAPAPPPLQRETYD